MVRIQMSAYYILPANGIGDPEGPYTDAQIRDLRAKRVISDTHLVAQDGSSAWRTVHETFGPGGLPPAPMARATLPPLPGGSCITDEEAVVLRNTHREREKILKKLGWLWLSVGPLLLLSSLKDLSQINHMPFPVAMMALVLVGVRCAQIYAGWHLRKLEEKAINPMTVAIIAIALLSIFQPSDELVQATGEIVTTTSSASAKTGAAGVASLFCIFGTVSLMFIPVGAVMLYLVHSAKGRMVLSPEYQRIITISDRHAAASK